MPPDVRWPMTTTTVSQQPRPSAPWTVPMLCAAIVPGAKQPSTSSTTILLAATVAAVCQCDAQNHTFCHGGAGTICTAAPRRLAACRFTNRAGAAAPWSHAAWMVNYNELPPRFCGTACRQSCTHCSWEALLRPNNKTTAHQRRHCEPITANSKRVNGK
jgi:hypothetical protein